ncbi:MAG: hypothetical protein PHY09_05940 [Desulfuromonadaceae bacterium]|nr:hypothetical protein [Desulfuromonadaceae bacterium]MDD5107216.1 hypothetical protein [Desulfuromonadaceae bacterium]
MFDRSRHQLERLLAVVIALSRSHRISTPSNESVRHIVRELIQQTAHNE